MSKRNAKKADEPVSANPYGSYCRYCGSSVRPGNYMCDVCKTWRHILDYCREYVKPRVISQFPVTPRTGPIPEKYGVRHVHDSQ